MIESEWVVFIVVNTLNSFVPEHPFITTRLKRSYDLREWIYTLHTRAPTQLFKETIDDTKVGG